MTYNVSIEPQIPGDTKTAAGAIPIERITAMSASPIEKRDAMKKKCVPRLIARPVRQITPA